MIKYEMTERKPLPTYKVEHDDRFAEVKKTEDNRWELRGLGTDCESLFFKSRRAAFYFFETGEKFKTNPVFAVLGGRKGQRRIR
jgi:hypothetical protein